MINIKDIKSLPRYSIYVLHFKLAGLTSIDRYCVRIREIEKSETGAKPLVRGQGAKQLEAECVSINQYILEMKFNVSPYFSCIHYRQARMRNKHWHKMDIIKI